VERLLRIERKEEALEKIEAEEIRMHTHTKLAISGEALFVKEGKGVVPTASRHIKTLKSGLKPDVGFHATARTPPTCKA